MVSHSMWQEGANRRYILGEIPVIKRDVRTRRSRGISSREDMRNARPQYKSVCSHSRYAIIHKPMIQSSYMPAGSESLHTHNLGTCEDLGEAA